jgi:hypothetical protein
MNHVERAKRIVVAVSLCLCLGSLAAVQSRSPVNKIWVGLTYAAAKQGASPEKIAVMGVAGSGMPRWSGRLWNHRRSGWDSGWGSGRIIVLFRLPGGEESSPSQTKGATVNSYVKSALPLLRLFCWPANFTFVIAATPRATC